MGRGRLPVVYLPKVDERLSSWAARMAPFYAMTVSEFVAALGLQGHDVFDLEWRLSEGQGVLIAARTGLSPEAVQAMTFRELGSAARMMIVRKNRFSCPHCPEDLHRKAASLRGDFTARCMVWSFGTRPARPCPTGSVRIALRNLKGMPRPVPRISMSGRAARGRATWGYPKCSRF